MNFIKLSQPLTELQVNERSRGIKISKLIYTTPVKGYLNKSIKS